MAIQTFKEILNNNGYRIQSDDRKIFEEGNFQSFFGFSENDAIEFIVYDINDNQLPQKNFGLARYISLSTENIKDYFLIAEGTLFQKYKLPSEYFIDIERLLKEAGYTNGLYKTQITLINKRVGSEKTADKLWISEISPSRTEVRLFPIKNNNIINPSLLERFNLFINNGDFRDDTSISALNFIEKITPITIREFIKTKYTEDWYTRLKTEFKIKNFEAFVTTIHNKFVQSAIFEFTNRISNINDLNYGKSIPLKPKVALSKDEIKQLCKKLLIDCIDYYLEKPVVKDSTTFNKGILSSVDTASDVLQKLEENTTITTKDPVIKAAELTKPFQTNSELQFEKDIKKEIPPVEIPLPEEPQTGGGGGGGGGGYIPIGDPNDGGLGRPNLGDGGQGREPMAFR
jgi:hypothetical protein